MKEAINSKISKTVMASVIYTKSFGSISINVRVLVNNSIMYSIFDSKWKYDLFKKDNI